MKTRMKLLDYTLISLLGTLAPAAWAQTAATPATEQTVLKIRSEGETGSVDTSPEGLQAFRRVDITQVNPGTIPVSGKFLISLPAGGMIWATEDPQLATPVLNVQANSLVALADGKIVGPVSFQTYSNYAAFAEKYELRIYRGTDTDLVDPVAVLSAPVANFGQVEWDGSTSGSLNLREGDELQYVLRAIAADGNFDETHPNRIQLIRPEEVQRAQNNLMRSASGETAGWEAADIQRRDLQSAIFGQSNLRQQNIAIYGSRVRVIGQDIPAGMPLKINGQSYPVDLERKFAAEFLLPVGKHSFDVETGTGDQVAHRQLDVDVTGKYFFMVGLADLTVSDNDISGSVAPVGLLDRYDGTITEGRLAFYLKGKVQGKYLITAQADTTERQVEEMFSGFFDPDARDIFRRLDPDQYYPIYGDDSTTTRDVDTQGRLYVRVDWDKNQALWGNFSTGLTGSEYSQYVRSLYGAAISWRTPGSTSLGNAKAEVRAFGSEAQNAPGHTEFLGTGGSLYYLKHSDLLPGSDKVTVETRDPLTGRVENRHEMVRGIDYEIDELQGRLLLTRPLSQIVRDNLPTITRDQPLDGFDNILMVDYEYIPDGFDTDQLTSGISGNTWIGDHVNIGGTYVDENRSGDDYKLTSGNITFQAGKGTYLRLEQAHTESSSANIFYSDNGGLSFTEMTGYDADEGDASSIEARINLKEMGWTENEWTIGAWWRDVDAGFSVARYSRGYDIQEQGFEFAGQVSEDVRVSGRYSDAERGDESLEQGQVLVEWRIGENNRLIGELRYITENHYYGSGTGTLAAVKYSHRFGSALDVYGIAQFTLDDDDGAYDENDAFTIGAKYLLGNLSSFGAELSHGDRGGSATINAEYMLTPLHTLYAGYTHSTDTTEGDPLFGRAQPTGLTMGQRWRISNQVNLFNESQFLKTRNESGIAHTFGMDLYPREGWNVGFTLQQGELNSDQGGGDYEESYSSEIDRRAISVNAGHTSPRSQWNSKLEYRNDSGAEERTQWVSSSRIMFKVNPDWRIAARLNWSDTDDRYDPIANAKFIEGNVGFAYRPIKNDRLQVLGKFTYLYDLSSFGQDSLSEYDQRSKIVSLEGIYRLNKEWEVAGKLAHRNGQARIARDTGPWFDSTADFAAFQARYELMHKWDALVEYRWLSVDENDSERHGWLIGLDRHVGDNFRVGLGYNFTEFSDNLADLDYDHKGWFLNLTGTY